MCALSVRKVVAMNDRQHSLDLNVRRGGCRACLTLCQFQRMAYALVSCCRRDEEESARGCSSNGSKKGGKKSGVRGLQRYLQLALLQLLTSKLSPKPKERCSWLSSPTTTAFWRSRRHGADGRPCRPV